MTFVIDIDGYDFIDKACCECLPNKSSISCHFDTKPCFVLLSACSANCGSDLVAVSATCVPVLLAFRQPRPTHPETRTTCCMLVTGRNASVIKLSMACKQESFQKKKTGPQQKFNLVLDMYVCSFKFITNYITNEYTDSYSVKNVCIVINHYPQ